MGKDKTAPELPEDMPEAKKPKKIVVSHHDDDTSSSDTKTEAVEPQVVDEEKEVEEPSEQKEEQETEQNDVQDETETDVEAEEESTDEENTDSSQENEDSEDSDTSDEVVLKETDESDESGTADEEKEDDEASAEEESSEDGEPDEKQVGPSGPYRPELTKTIEEAEAEAEETRADAFKPDPEVDAAVDDIVRTESDEAIAESDAKIEAAASAKKSTGLTHKIKQVFRGWWESKPARYGTLLGIGALITIVLLLPATRYTVLNTLGVRVSSSMRVIDSQTRLPLKNIQVRLQDKEAQTDAEGLVNFDDIKLGESELAITKRGYADNIRSIVLGWGSNPIGDQELVATGEQFTFVLTDWQTFEPISDAEATAGESSAQADSTGKIVLTVGDESVGDIEIEVSANGYRTELVTFTESDPNEIALSMVPGRRHAFVSNRDGQFDLYAVDVDGQNESVVLAATGQEREVPFVLPKPQENIIAYVSSRDGETNSDGFVLDGLFIIDLTDGSLEKVTRSEQLRLIGWSGDVLVYWQIVEGTSAGNPERSKLIAYNYRSGERTELAAANYFNSVLLVDDTMYYAVSSFAVPQSQAKLFSVKVDGSNKETVIDTQVWNIFRTAYDTLLFSAVDQKWFEKVGDAQATEIGPQTVTATRRFVDSPSSQKSAWVEIRDGKGVLLVVDTETGEEQTVLSLPGLNSVEYWVGDDNIVFKVITNTETADYFINLQNGEALKIRDVTATRNIYF